MDSHPLSAQLPIHDLLPEIVSALDAHSGLILEAAPGAGKTTQVPLAMRHCSWLAGRKIVLLQPRRIAAKNAAERMSALLEERTGETVGYRMRQDTRVGPATQIEVVTEGVLLRMLREDPTLSDVGLLIFDEFHERSLASDLGLTLALQARRTFSEEAAFKILVMSATLADDGLTQILDAPRLVSEGRQYPVEIHYGHAKKPGERIIERAQSAIQSAVKAHPHSSILVFLPGQREIRALANALETYPATQIHLLYGDLEFSQQRRAIAPSNAGQRKIVLATNIAETSLTIDGVDVVIDTGLQRVSRYDPNTGMGRLETVTISKASAEQRRGRAGRLRPGHCYRLWSEHQQAELAPAQTPEIGNADLTDLCLQLFAWGIYEPDELAWLTPPSAGAFRQARDLLAGLGAIQTTEGGDRLTPHGSAMAELPLHPRLAHLLLKGQAVGAPDTAALIAAVLSERMPARQEPVDMRSRLEVLTGETRCPQELGAWERRVSRLANDFLKGLPRDAPAIMQRPDRDQLCGFLLALAYPDRIARLRHAGAYQLANGRSGKLPDGESFRTEKWLAVAQVTGSTGQKSDTIRCACPLDSTLFDGPLKDLVSVSTDVRWDAKSGRFIAEEQRRCGALILAKTALKEIDTSARVKKLIAMIAESKLTALAWSASSRSFLKRAQLMNSLLDEWPDFSTDCLTRELAVWLGPYLSDVQRLKDLKNIDLLEALRARLDWTQRETMERWLPTSVTVASGSRIQINYDETPPVISVKLQEMFGNAKEPTLAEGRLKPVIHLLSPAGRPLQVTRDLNSFWKNGYEDVKKEMRGRYPKHPWPDDPLSAAPTKSPKARSRRS